MTLRLITLLHAAGLLLLHVRAFQTPPLLRRHPQEGQGACVIVSSVTGLSTKYWVC